MEKELTNREIVAEIRNFRQEIILLIDTHTIADETFQKKMEPVVKAFENKKIARMVFEEETNTLYIYAKKVLTFSTLLAGGYYVSRWLIHHLP